MCAVLVEQHSKVKRVISERTLKIPARLKRFIIKVARHAFNRWFVAIKISLLCYFSTCSTRRREMEPGISGCRYEKGN